MKNRYRAFTTDGNLNIEGNLETARLAFDSAKRAGIQRGVTLTLVDTRTGKTIDKHTRLSGAGIDQRVRDDALEYAARCKKRGERIIVWAKELIDAVTQAKDPGQLLQNADMRCEDAGLFRVGAIIEHMLNADTPAEVQQVHDFLLSEALRGARHPRQSSSTTSNVVALGETAAYATAADELDRILQWAKTA